MQPERVPVQSNGSSGQAQPGNGNGPQAQSRDEAQADKLRKRLIEIAVEQGLNEEQVGTAVVNRTGKSLDDLTAAELGPLAEAAAAKLRQMQQAQSLPRT